MPLKKAVIVPGNGAGNVEHSNWYGWANKKIEKVGQSLENIMEQTENISQPITIRSLKVEPVKMLTNFNLYTVNIYTVLYILIYSK